MRSKVLSLLLVLVLLLATFSTAFAQAEPFCGDLDEADCALLTAASENMQEVASYQASAVYSTQLVGIPGLPLSEAAVDVMVGGAFSYDDAALAAAQELAAATSQEEIAALMSESPDLFVDFYNGWAFDAQIDVAVSEELATALSADAGIVVPTALSVPLILADGILYADVTELAPLMEGGESMTGWIGFELGRLLEAAADQGIFEQAAASMEPEAVAMASGSDAATAAALMGLSAALSDPAAFEQFQTVERVDDGDLDGTPVAVFVTTFDVLSFISSPQFVDLITGLVDSGVLGADAPSAADIEQTMQMVGLMGPMIFQGLTAASTTMVSLDEPNYILGQRNSFDWDLAGLLQMVAMSGALPADQMSSDASTISISTTVINSAIDEEQTIEAPADAVIVPAEAMMQ